MRFLHINDVVIYFTENVILTYFLRRNIKKN